MCNLAFISYSGPDRMFCDAGNVLHHADRRDSGAFSCDKLADTRVHDAGRVCKVWDDFFKHAFDRNILAIGRNNLAVTVFNHASSRVNERDGRVNDAVARNNVTSSRNNLAAPWMNVAFASFNVTDGRVNEREGCDKVADALWMVADRVWMVADRVWMVADRLWTVADLLWAHADSLWAIAAFGLRSRTVRRPSRSSASGCGWRVADREPRRAVADSAFGLAGPLLEGAILPERIADVVPEDRVVPLLSRPTFGSAVVKCRQPRLNATWSRTRLQRFMTLHPTRGTRRTWSRNRCHCVRSARGTRALAMRR